MDALDLLTADHARVRGLFTRFQAAHDGGDDAAAIALAQRICDELEVHATIEEEVFYPAVHDVTEEISETVDEGLQEHHVAKTLMDELGRVQPGGDEWTAKMMVLVENVQHHADEEEQELFPSLRSACDAAMLEDLAARLEDRKKSLGAPVLADKIDLTKRELLELASEQAIPGRSSMTQEQLAAAVAPR